MAKRGALNTGLSLLLTAAACGGTPPAPAPGVDGATQTTPAGPQAIVVEVINQVEARPVPVDDWMAALANMPIYLGGAVRAQEASTARVKFQDDLIRVAPNTVFTLEQPDANTVRLDLQQGQVWLNVEGLAPGQDFNVETSDAVASVRGTRFSVSKLPGAPTIVSTKVHTVTVSAQGTAVELGPEQQTSIAAGQPPAPPGPLAVDQEVLWGMALGPDLEALLPATQVSQVITYTGSVSSNGSLSADGRYFTSYAYDPTSKNGSSLIYDLEAGRAISDTLPLDAASMAYSPAGSQVAWDSLADKEMCTASPDGSDPSCFALPSYPGFPFWSPDGQWLLFYVSTGPGSNLFKAHPDGSDLTQLTFTSSGENHAQAWSPDGTQIAYQFQPKYDQPGELWVMEADGANPFKLMDGTSGFENPVWTPNGQSLLVGGFVTPGSAAGGGLFLVALDGSAPLTLIPPDQGWSVFNLQFSGTPSGWPLVFDSRNMVTKLGAGLQILTGPGAEPQLFSNATWGPVWTPDHRSAAFGSVETVNADTGATETTIYLFQVQTEFWPQQ